MNEPKPNSIAVPKILWDELENALWIRSKDLIQDISKTLSQDPKPLLQEFRSKKSSLYLIELERDSEEQFECAALETNTSVAHTCRRPVLYGRNYCPCHQFFQSSKEFENKPKLQRIDAEESIFVDTLTSQVYSEKYERIGYLQGTRCILFEIQEG
jgi:hypothetical protein